MIKLILFDLDGVLVDAKNIHYETLNNALPLEYRIGWEEHLSIYDGLKTIQKLELLTHNKGLSKDKYNDIWVSKQKFTQEKLENLEVSSVLKNTIKQLSLNGYKLGVASNSIRKTVNLVLSKLDIIQYFDTILSNEDIFNSKPHPEIYWKSMSMLNILPEDTLIIEDSPYGLLAANRSNANIYRVKNPKDINYDNIINEIKKIENRNMMPKWKDKKLNVLIPMAGAGSRFADAGYTFPKPLIEVNGKPMIQVVVENLNIDANYIYVVQKEHRKKYNLDTLLNLITPDCKIVEVEGITEGAACTALLAKEFIDNDKPLFFANSDQFVEWDSTEFMYKMNESNVDGGIIIFKSTHPKWSFARLNDDGLISEVAEKNPISDNATVGFYYWKYGKDFVKYAEQMIINNIRVNNEFYVCPVFNEAINDGKKILPFNAKNMYGLGTPEDLNNFLLNHK
jgi:HAD superfamily hydrolase (TIGR01509 family)